ncbi:glycosyltransferase [Bacillus coahuilensis]|nr:glycosyltransferase [Bacillus coahuilensis]
MSRAHALVFPSIREGWGLTISESAVCGTPSIVYDAPGVRDAIAFGKAGYLVKQRGPTYIVSYMKKVIEEVEDYENMVQNAFVFSKRLDWTKTAEQFEDKILYHHIQKE